jgi:two-component system, chemotaxis family, chemotaxis protein CheY
MRRPSNFSAIGTDVAAVPVSARALRYRPFAHNRPSVSAHVPARVSARIAGMLPRAAQVEETRQAGYSVRKQRRRVFMASTVLVVDDDLGLRETLRALLELEGYEVALAGDGLDALRALEGLAPDAILLDLMMPRMNGEEFVQELSRRGRRTEFPIIILSADTRARQTAAQVGARACLPKPFDVDDLLSQLERAVAH